MIKSALVRAVFGFCDSTAFKDARPDAATVATLVSPWSAL